MKSIITIAAHTGMRLNELLSLRWKQVELDYSNPYIELPNQKNGTNTPQRITQTSVNVLSAIPKNSESPFVFPSTKDSSKHFKEIRNQWSKALKAAGLEHRKFHALRHTTVAILASLGVPFNEISAYVRHKSLAITKVYDHQMPGYQNRAVSILDAAIPLNQKEVQKTD